MRLLTALLAVGLVGLAGCSGKSPTQQPSIPDPTYSVQPTATTGIIRGVVVDSAIRPVEDATVVLKVGSGQDRTTKSAADGGFGFEGLEPGTYFLTVSKLGHVPAQSSADVVAGVAEPPIVRVLLAKDSAAIPYYEILQWDGFIQCSARFVVNAIAACSAAPDSADNFTYRYHPATVPAFAQTEMVWKSTQALGDGLKLEYTDDRDGGLDNYAIAVGGSPLMINANQTTLLDKGIDGDTGLYVRVFAGSVEGTVPPACVPTQPCEGASVVVNQAFTAYTILFYFFEPPEGYLFVNDGAPMVPA